MTQEMDIDEVILGGGPSKVRQESALLHQARVDLLRRIPQSANPAEAAQLAEAYIRLREAGK